MEFNNLNELLEKKENATILQQKYEEAVVESKNHKKQCNRHGKKYWDPIIANYKRIVKKHQDEIFEINKKIYELSNYPKELIIPFIMECINLHETEKYTSRMIVLSNTTHLSSTETIPSYSNYEVIFPESLLEEETKLEQTFYISVLSIAYKELFESHEAKYTLLPSSGYFQTITNELTLNGYFENFPYLQEIFVNLIDRRLREPNKKMKEILDDELTELKEEQKRKIKD